MVSKQLLSGELAIVLSDLENARQAINEKYSIIGSPAQIPAPLLSGDLAEAIRKIMVSGQLNLGDAIQITHNAKEKGVAGGYYPNGVAARLQDYAVSYVWNREGYPAKTQYVKIHESFQIPDFGIEEIDGEELQGWSHMPNDEDPEYLTGDIVNDFQYEPRIEDSEYVSYLYAVWRVSKINPITLEFEYLNGGKLISNKEVVKMKVIGQNPNFPGLAKREYLVQSNPPANEDIAVGDNFYTHEFTFDTVGIYPVIVTHTSKSGKQEMAAGVIKVAGSNGTMGGSGKMESHKGIGSWYDSGWVSPNVVPGVFITEAKFYLKFSGHGNGTDALAMFVKKTDGSTYIVWDYDSKTNTKVDLTNLDSKNLTSGGPTTPIVFNPVTLKRTDLASTPHYIPGPNGSIMMEFTKADDVRQVRFFVFSSHDTPSCMSGATIDYDLNYDFDMDMWESDKK